MEIKRVEIALLFRPPFVLIFQFYSTMRCVIAIHWSLLIAFERLFSDNVVS